MNSHKDETPVTRRHIAELSAGLISKYCGNNFCPTPKRRTTITGIDPVFHHPYNNEPRRTIRILRGSFLFMSLYCFPIRMSAAGSDIGLFLTGGRMIEEGFRRFVIAIQCRHGVGDGLSAAVIL